MKAYPLAHPADPLEEVEAWIDKARDVREPIIIRGDESFDPLSRLKLHLAQGHPSANQEPLVSLYEDLTAGQTIPPVEPHRVSDDPMASLEALASGQAPEREEAHEVEQPPGEDHTAIEGILGREVLALAGSSALPPEARKEALERVAIALENPSRENVRAILLALVRD